MSREILWYHTGVEDVTQLAARNSRQATRILLAVKAFGRHNEGDLKKLSGSEQWRLRVGDWRVMMLLVESLAYITEIDNRRDAY